MATAKEIVKAHYDRLNAQSIEGCRLENVIAYNDEEREKAEAQRKAFEEPDAASKEWMAMLREAAHSGRLSIEDKTLMLGARLHIEALSKKVNELL